MPIVTNKKSDLLVKARMCVERYKQEIHEEEVSSPTTISTEALSITLAIDTDKGRDVATIDIL